MRIEDECVEGFQIRGIKHKGGTWRIKVRLEADDVFVHDYWVTKGKLHHVLPQDLYRPGAAVDDRIKTSEHNAVLRAVELWETSTPVRVRSAFKMPVQLLSGLIRPVGRPHLVGKHPLLVGALLIAGSLRQIRAQTTCTPAAADQNYSQGDAKHYIEESEAEWATSVATNDASVLLRILSDDFVWILDDQILDKATAIRVASEGPGQFLTNKLDYVHLRFFGPVAVAQGSEHWTKSRGAAQRRGRFLWTDTWVRCGGAWKIVSSQDNSVAPAR